MGRWVLELVLMLLRWWCRCGDERVCPAVLHRGAAGLDAEVWEQNAEAGAIKRV